MNLAGSGIRVKHEFTEDYLSLPQPLTIPLIRMPQAHKYINIKHSLVKKACISLGLSENEVYLQIKDDWHHFDPNRIDNEAIHKHYCGLIGIHERIVLVTGMMSICSYPEYGTTFIVNLPLKRSEES